MRVFRLVRTITVVALFAFTLGTFAQPPQDLAPMEKEFQNPPDSAKPRVWWHWMSGNVTQEGITADLEWMHRVGIAGMQMFDADLGGAHYHQCDDLSGESRMASSKNIGMKPESRPRSPTARTGRFLIRRDCSYTCVKWTGPDARRYPCKYS